MTFIKGSILFTTLLISRFVTSILDWSQIATGSFLSMLFAIFLFFEITNCDLKRIVTYYYMQK